MDWRLLPLGILGTLAVLLVVPTDAVDMLRVMAATGFGYIIWEIGSSMTRRK